jgi:predicted PurR-regulated permease PerM
LVYLFSLFVVLFGIAVWLSVFVFPAIIAIRKHGWFDNVVDTIEAVGTKPHVLFGSLLLSLLMMCVAGYIGMAGMDQLKSQAKYLPESMRSGFNDTEGRASDFATRDMKFLVNKHLLRHVSVLPELPGESSGIYNRRENNFYQYGTGPVAGVWQALILALILGYIANLFVAGGMLTYLVVREDDYWDDEDLEDLDKLAKELEEEAKRDQGVTSAEAAKPAETAKAPEAAKPPEPPTPTDPAKA